VALLALAAPLVLRPFGADYSSEGTTLLRLLLLATLPQGIVSLYIGVERVRARVGRVLAVEALAVVAVVCGAVLGMHALGLAGAGVAFLVSQSGLALFVLPRLSGVGGR
jgi:O-antigen/teichoic acid export membrane protein